jgi:ribose 5-phosphate isomerase
LSEREHIKVAERQTIARLAIGVVEPDDVLMIGGGITMRFFAQALALYRDPSPSSPLPSMLPSHSARARTSSSTSFPVNSTAPKVRSRARRRLTRSGDFAQRAPFSEHRA